MKKTAFDRRDIVEGQTVIRAIVTTPKSKRTTRKGLVTEVTDTTVTIINNFKKETYKIADLIGLTIEGQI